MAEINISNLGGGGGGTLTLTTTGTGGASTYVAGVLNIPVYQGQLTLTTSGTSGAATLVGDTLNIPQYQGAITLTTTGTSGASTFVSNALNIPQYQGAITLTTTGTSGASTLIGNTLNIPNYLSSSAPAGSNGQVQFNSSGNFGASSNFNWDNTNSWLGIGTATPSAGLQIVGYGSTSGTSSLLVQNSSSTDLLRVDDSGVLTIGASSSLSSIGASQITSSSSLTNSNIVLNPKGAGAIIAGLSPSGTAAGGNARGISSVDFQLVRTGATQVASGERAALIGGQKNRADGNDSGVFSGSSNISSGSLSGVIAGESNTSSGRWSAVLGGNSNTSSGLQSAVCGGESNQATGSNSMASGRFAFANLFASQSFASDRFSATGDAMTLNWRYMRSITGTGIAELFIDNSSARAILVSNRLWNVNLQVSAICSTVGNGVGITLGDSFVGVYQVGIKRLVNTTTLVGTVQNVITAQSDTGMSTSAVTISADDATGNESLKVEFTPPTTAASTTVIRVVVTATATVVGY
jgi:hypothetical protein